MRNDIFILILFNTYEKRQRFYLMTSTLVTQYPIVQSKTVYHSWEAPYWKRKVPRIDERGRVNGRVGSRLTGRLGPRNGTIINPCTVGTTCRRSEIVISQDGTMVHVISSMFHDTTEEERRVWGGHTWGYVEIARTRIEKKTHVSDSNLLESGPDRRRVRVLIRSSIHEVTASTYFIS